MPVELDYRPPASRSRWIWFWPLLQGIGIAALPLGLAVSYEAWSVMQYLYNPINSYRPFLAFNIIDGCTAGKSREPLLWLFQEVTGKVESRFSAADIIG
jgi:hypothetical protein